MSKVWRRVARHLVLRGVSSYLTCQRCWESLAFHPIRASRARQVDQTSIRNCHISDGAAYRNSSDNTIDKISPSESLWTIQKCREVIICSSKMSMLKRSNYTFISSLVKCHIMLHIVVFVAFVSSYTFCVGRHVIEHNSRNLFNKWWRWNVVRAQTIRISMVYVK